LVAGAVNSGAVVVVVDGATVIAGGVTVETATKGEKDAMTRQDGVMILVLAIVGAMILEGMIEDVNTSIVLIGRPR